MEEALSLKPRLARPARLRLNVVHTSVTGTRAALGAAARLSAVLEARIRIIVLRAVPYPLPLDSPQVSMEHDCERALALIDKISPDATLFICYCRDALDSLLQLLGHSRCSSRFSSIVVMGGRKRRPFPTKAQSMAAKLEKAGHRVVFVETE